MNFYSRKTRRRITVGIVVVLVLAMVVPLIVSMF